MATAPNRPAILRKKQTFLLPSLPVMSTPSTLPRSQWSWSLSKSRAESEFQVLIIHYEQQVVLVRQEDGHWVVPGFHADHSGLWTVALVNGTLGTLGVPMRLWVARLVWRRELEYLDEAKYIQYTLDECVAVMECCEQKPPTVHGYQWMPLTSTAIFHAFAEAQACIRQEMDMALRGTYPIQRIIWERPGWFLKTLSWMEKELKLKVIEPIIHIRSSVSGAVFGCTTARGKFFLKCSPPCEDDVSFTAAMSEIVPQYCPMPVCIDRATRMMVTADYGELLRTVFHFNTDTEGGLELSRVWAELQMATIGRTGELLEAGMIDASPERLLDRFDEILAHPELRTLEEYEASDKEWIGRDGENVKVLREKADVYKRNLEQRLEELMALKIPATVLHNDLYSGNVSRNSLFGKLTIFDWARGCVGHPFMDYSHKIGMSKEATSSYLKQWEDYGSADELRACLRSARNFTSLMCFCLVLMPQLGSKVPAKEKNWRGLESEYIP